MRSAFALAVCLAALAACDATNTTPDRAESTPLPAMQSVRVTLAGQVATVSLPDGAVSVRTVAGGAVNDSLLLRSPAVPLPPAAPPGPTALAGALVLDSLAQAQFLREAESRLVVYESGPLALRVTDRESLYAVQNLNDGDYAVGRTFSVSLPAGQAASGTLRLRMTRFEGAAKRTSTAPGPVQEFDVAIPYAIVPLP